MRVVGWSGSKRRSVRSFFTFGSSTGLLSLVSWLSAQSYIVRKVAAALGASGLFFAMFNVSSKYFGLMMGRPVCGLTEMLSVIVFVASVWTFRSACCFAKTAADRS